MCRYEYPYVYSGLDMAHLAFFGPVSPHTGLNPKSHPDEHSTRLPCTGQEHGSSAAALPPLRPASPAASPRQDRHDSSAATPPPLHQAHNSVLEVSDSFPVFHPLIPLFLTSSDMNMAAIGDDLLCLFDLHMHTTICFDFLFSRRWQQ
jgi:hypothetical protein